MKQSVKTYMLFLSLSDDLKRAKQELAVQEAKYNSVTEWYENLTDEEYHSMGDYAEKEFDAAEEAYSKAWHKAEWLEKAVAHADELHRAMVMVDGAEEG